MPKVQQTPGNENTTVGNKRQRRPQPKVSFDIIDKTKYELGIDKDTELSSMLGFHSDTVSKWRSEGEVPVWIEHACIGLVSLHRDKSGVLIVRPPQGKHEVVIHVLEAMEIPYHSI